MAAVGRMRSVIERRMLINYRVDPVVASGWVPDGFRVQIVDGSALAGICMTRVARMVPRGVPGPLGWRGENAAARVAVEWVENDVTHRGTFILRRFSASAAVVAVGGRLFPGVHDKATITSTEAPHRITVELRTSDAPTVTVDADVAFTTRLRGSVFPTVSDAAEFFSAAATEWSPARTADRLDGLRLDAAEWSLDPTTPIRVRSSLFDDLADGVAELDSVLVMRDVAAEWVPVPTPPMAAMKPRV
ncbi:DUF2071 domain-containing protein [Williamsia sp.]|uniref:DUF2071 domain-containing protein n=1 Tax=Williamsia sp. TaxID=1872085 RepID=UPI001A18F7B8|nr:DUF2071 domain-containing protein [Williamsia sp.]MBJ7291608.1 DUF2071 domain-containing protein [Williamsia sp.]